jgi:predicted MPP superfamily phosphohydrolase
VRVLANESVVFEKADGSMIRLTGVDDPRTKRDRLKLALSEPPEARHLYTILLAHAPSVVDRFDETTHADLILCGDTHGGQVVLPFIGPLAGRPKLLKYRCGWFDLRMQQTTRTVKPRLFVSCGFGTSGLPIRLGAPAELHLFTLRCPSRSDEDQARLKRDR